MALRVDWRGASQAIAARVLQPHFRLYDRAALYTR